MARAPVTDPKTIALLAGAAAILVGAVAGVVKITTPEASECAVDLADARARVELLTEAKDACKAALSACTEGP